ncbi:MAG: hypothetical protein ABI780_07830 [Ardenticatenales bacterium]
MPSSPVKIGPRSVAAATMAVAVATLLAGPCLSLAPSPSTVHAQPPSTPLRLDIVDQLGGASYAVAAAEPYVYVGVGPRLFVLSVDAQGGLTAISRTTILPGVVRDIALDGRYAYLALMDGSPQAVGGALAIIDVSNPLLPLLRGVLTDRAAYTAIGVAGGFALLAGGADWRVQATFGGGVVDVIDVRDVDAPVRVDRLAFAHPLSDLAVDAGTARVFAIEPRSNPSGSAAVRTIDIANPLRPERIALATFVGVPELVADSLVRKLPFGDFIGLPGQVAVAGGRLMLAGGQSGLSVVDVGADGEPRGSDHIATGGCADGVAVDGDRLAVIDRCAARLHVYGAATVGRPVEVGATDASPTAASAAWMGDRLVVAGGTGGGVALYDTAGGGLRAVGRWGAPGSLTELGLVSEEPGRHEGGDVADIVVGLGAERVTAFSISFDGTVRAGGTVAVPGANGFAVAGGRAYVSTGEGQRLEVVELTDPDHPRLGPGFTADGNILALAIGDGPTAYIDTVAADRAPRIDTLDVRASGAPQRIGQLYDFDAAILRSDHNRLYAYSGSGTSIIDTAAPAAMKALSRNGSFMRSDVVAAMAPYGDRLYLSTASNYECPAFICNRIALVDVSDPTTAGRTIDHVVGEDRAPSALTVDGDHIWAGGGDAVRVIDRLALERRYVLLAESATPGTVYAVAVAARDGDWQRAYAADGDGGLVVLRLAPAGENPPPPPVVTLGAPPLTPTPSASPAQPGRYVAYLPYVARAAALPATPRILTLTDEVGGPSRAVTWAGDVIYRGKGGRIISYDAVDPASPHESGRTAPLPGLIFDLAVDRSGGSSSGNSDVTLYAAAGTAGLAVYDLADPHQPALLARVPTGDTAYAVAAAGGVAVVAAGDDGLRVFDVSDRGRPRRIGALTFDARVLDVQLNRGFAYAVLAAGRPIQVVDMQDPADPRRVAELSAPGDSFGGGLAMAIVGDHAYVQTCSNCLKVFTIADPTTPRLEASFFDWYGYTMLADGDRLLLMAKGIQVIDIGDPAVPRAAGSVHLGFTVYDAAVNDGRVAVATGNGFPTREDYGEIDAGPLEVVDIRDADHPVVVANVEYPADAAGAIFPTGRPDRLYMGSWPTISYDGEPMTLSAAAPRLAQAQPPTPVRLVDASDPSHLRLAERVPALDGVWWMRVVDGTGYAMMPRASDADTSGFALTTWDLTDVAAPRRLGSVDVAAGYVPGGIALDGAMIYVVESIRTADAWSSSRLIVIDVSDPALPRIRDRLPLPDICWSLSVIGGRAYTRAAGQLLVLDITSPAGLRLIDRIRAPFLAGGGDVLATERDVWIATWRGLAHVDVRPGAGAAATLQVRGRFQALAPMSGGRLIATDYGVSVFDVRTSTARQIARFDAPDYGPVPGFGVTSRIPIGERVFAYFVGPDVDSAPGPAVLTLSP